MTLLVLWGLGLLLLAVALVATLIPPSRSWHRVGVTLVCTLALVGVAGAAVATWSWVVVTQDDLYEAAETVSDAEHTVPGRLSQQRLMALVSEELDHDVFADPAGATSEEEVYDVRPAGTDGPTVCVRVQHMASTASALPASVLSVDRGRCD